MNIWIVEQRIDGEYSPIEMEYSRDMARVVQRSYKARMERKHNVKVSTRIRRYERDSFSRG